MEQKSDELAVTDGPDVASLLHERTTVQEWLRRLDTQQGRVSDRILAKVRADYEARLQATIDALASHRAALEEELDRTVSRLGAAEHDRQVAIDELEEAELRFGIGETDEAAWARLEPRLREAVEGAGRREEEIRDEAERLQQLLDQLEERVDTLPSPVFDLGQDATAADPVTLLASTHSAPEADAEPEIAEIPEITIPPAEKEAFLDEIDRALAAPAPGTYEPPAEDTAPKPGLKCAECGYTNDLSAWFCGVCGADVG